MCLEDIHRINTWLKRNEHLTKWIVALPTLALIVSVMFGWVEIILKETYIISINETNISVSDVTTAIDSGFFCVEYLNGTKYCGNLIP